MADASEPQAVYGLPDLALAVPGAGARQLSPLTLGASTLEDVPEASLARIVVAAPPGVLERRYVLALALRALRPGGVLIAMAPKDRGGTRLRKELQAFGCEVAETAKRHQRLCQCARPAELVDADIAAGGPQIAPRLGLWSQPGVFSWDRLDPGTAALIPRIGDLAGRGADLGCGVGPLAKAVLASPAVTSLALLDIDLRALAAARRNVTDPRASFAQRDLWNDGVGLTELDFVVSNPPFHQGGDADRLLGQGFVVRAAQALRPGGVLRLVANIALPYEATLKEAFARVTPLAVENGYKVIEARK